MYSNVTSFLDYFGLQPQQRPPPPSPHHLNKTTTTNTTSVLNDCKLHDLLFVSSILVYFGTILRLFSDHFNSIWMHFSSISDPFWSHFGSPGEFLQKTPQGTSTICVLEALWDSTWGPFFRENMVFFSATPCRDPRSTYFGERGDSLIDHICLPLGLSDVM